MDCSVIVCTRNRPLQLQQCLKSLATMLPPSNVFVADSASTNGGEVQQIAKSLGCNYIRIDHPGLSKARNSAVIECRSEIVVFMDDDAIAAAGWISELVKQFWDSTIMAATGPVVPLRLESESEKIFDAMGGFVHLPESPTTFDQTTEDWFEFANFGGIGCGTNMAFRRSLFDQGFRFDERLGAGSAVPGCEDFYAFFRLIDQGFRIAYTPQAVVRHPYPSTMDDLRDRYQSGVATMASYVCFLLRHETMHRPALLHCVGKWIAGDRAVRRENAKPPFSFWFQWKARLEGIVRGFRV